MDSKATLLNFQQARVLVRDFNREDWPILLDLVAKRGLNKEEFSFVPKIGAIAYCGDMPVAIAFVREVEGKMALWDGLITNIDADAFKRNKALDEILIFIIRRVKDLGINQILSWSVDSHTIERVQKLGFKLVNTRLLTLQL